MKIPIKAIALLLALSALFFGYALIEPYLIEVKEISIASPQIPASFEGKKIIFISDVHLGEFFFEGRLADLAKQIDSLHPDIVILGGDYVSKEPDYVPSCLAQLGKLDNTLGVYGVIGNQDYWNGGRITPKQLSKYGITPLENAGAWVYSENGRIRIGGVEDYSYGDPNYLPAIYGANESDYVILVSHNPDYAEQVDDTNVDLLLAGHTHGGQVTFFGLWAPYMPVKTGQKYRSGFVKDGNMTVYVTRGIGTTFLPIRFFARPEITVITLKHT